MSNNSKQHEANGEFDEATLLKMLTDGADSAMQAGDYLLKQNAGYRVAMREMRRVHDEMQREAAAICEPANLLGLVTEVDRNGQLRRGGALRRSARRPRERSPLAESRESHDRRRCLRDGRPRLCARHQWSLPLEARRHVRRAHRGRKTSC